MTKVKIVFASITGNDEDIAYVLTEKFEELGCEVDMSEVSQTDAADFEDSDICVVASYTYDQGIVPDEALDFYDDMQDLDLSGKVYGVCGSGDTFTKISVVPLMNLAKSSNKSEPLEVLNQSKSN
ncbi:flavodoxin [Companilactobacillus farciminis]|nr:flavodoxin [Companilactobacillus farciminis]